MGEMGAEEEGGRMESVERVLVEKEEGEKVFWKGERNGKEAWG